MFCIHFKALSVLYSAMLFPRQLFFSGSENWRARYSIPPMGDHLPRTTPPLMWPQNPGTERFLSNKPLFWATTPLTQLTTSLLSTNTHIYPYLRPQIEKCIYFLEVFLSWTFMYRTCRLTVNNMSIIALDIRLVIQSFFSHILYTKTY
jgi:hypothetical protein